MNTLHSEELKQRMKALTDEEKEEMAKTLPNEILVAELNRRLTSMTDNINMVRDILKVQEEK